MFLCLLQRGQVYQISEILAKQLPVLYKLKDLMGDQISGNYYRQELIQTEKPEVFKIERILCKKKTKGNKFQYLVKWLYYGNKFNSYVSENDIIKGKHGDSESPVALCPRTRHTKS